MKKAEILVHGELAGHLEETEKGKKYRFTYIVEYEGAPVSLTMPLSSRVYEYDVFPPFFDGVLPEGIQLEGLLRRRKLDKNDYFAQLLAVGADLVGSVTVRPSE